MVDRDDRKKWNRQSPDELDIFTTLSSIHQLVLDRQLELQVQVDFKDNFLYYLGRVVLVHNSSMLSSIKHYQEPTRKEGGKVVGHRIECFQVTVAYHE